MPQNKLPLRRLLMTLNKLWLRGSNSPRMRRKKHPKHSLLRYKLYLKSHERYQITYNKKHQFANSQLAVLFDMPSDERLHAKSTIELVVAPPGVV